MGRNVLQARPGWAVGGPAVLMSDWWVREHWGRAFDIVEIAPQVHNMSWAVMRKREVELTTEDLERPGDDPREFVALRHNIRQLQRELDNAAASQQLLQAAHEQQAQQVEQNHADIGEVRRGYEGSASWQVTRPLRAGAKAARSIRTRRS